MHGRLVASLKMVVSAGLVVAVTAAAKPELEGQQTVQERVPEQAQTNKAPVIEDIETILTEPLGQEEYAETERCLSRNSFRSIEIIDNEHVLFRGGRGRAWLNTLRRACIGLRRNHVPKFEYRGNRLCSLDDFVGLDRGMSGFSRTSAMCVLGSFQAVTMEQVVLIKATVESRKGTRTRRKKDPGGK